MFYFNFLAGSAATLSLLFYLVLTYGAVSRWAEGGGTPGHLLMGGGVLRKKMMGSIKKTLGIYRITHFISLLLKGS